MAVRGYILQRANIGPRTLGINAVGLPLCAVDALATQRRSPQTWFVDSLMKVLISDAPGTQILKTAEFCGPRDQHLAIRLTLNSANVPANADVEAEAMTNDARHRVSTVRDHHVSFVAVGSHGPDTRRDEMTKEVPGQYPDSLLEFPLESEAR